VIVHITNGHNLPGEDRGPRTEFLKKTGEEEGEKKGGGQGNSHSILWILKGEKKRKNARDCRGEKKKGLGKRKTGPSALSAWRTLSGGEKQKGEEPENGKKGRKKKRE